jgi:predicted adenylyl cyclase CyaB
MPTNVEIKAIVRDWNRTCQAAVAISDSPVEILEQEDTFFACPHGRLKLRRFSARRGELIAYRRQNLTGPKSSRYVIAKTNEPGALRTVLADSLGVVGTVKKQRHLYLNGQTRIHLDKVDGLGTFLELEVVMQPEQPTAEGEQIARALMEKLEVKPEHLIADAYIDLILRRERSTTAADHSDSL